MAAERKETFQGALMGLVSLALLIGILFSPKASYQAALGGLDLWFRVVFPALLPFFIASEVMTGLGVVDFFGVLLRPLMGPLFKCPGSSSLIWAMSATSGYPVGARLVALFRAEKKISVEEGQRILSFSSTSGPLFMMGAVAVGMMGSPEAGRVILLSHYLAAILLGILFRNYRSLGYRGTSHPATLGTALKALTQARKKDGRPIGALLGDAVRNSVNLLLLVGGFIVLFSVIIDLMVRLQVIEVGAALVSFLSGGGLPVEFAIGLLGGILEITVGSRMLAEAPVSMASKIAGVSFLIGWSGFSIHGQTAGILSGSGIRFGLYMLTKLGQGILSALLSYPMTKLLYPAAKETFSSGSLWQTPPWQEVAMYSGSLLLFSLGLLLSAAIIFHVLARLRTK